MLRFSAVGKTKWLGIFAAALILPVQAQESPPATRLPAGAVMAEWRELNLQFPFPSLSTNYRCRTLQKKIVDVLTLVGAHPKTRARITGCQFEQASGNLFLSITTAVPVLAPAKPKEKTPLELSSLAQWGVEAFPAVWKQVNLARERNANLRPGDCELIQTLVAHAFSQMTVTVESSTNLCSPDVMKQQMADFKVTALVPLVIAKAD